MAQQIRFLDWGPLELECARGECIGITGPSGSGKTLFLKTLVDLLPHEGKLILDSREAESMPASLWRKKAGMLPSDCLWWHNRVSDHFTNSDGEQFLLLMERLGLDESMLQQASHQLSAGERQRLGLIRLLENTPQVLLLDEPTANLDRKNRLQVEALISNWQKDRKTTVLWVSHDWNQLKRVADRIYLMSKNELKELHEEPEGVSQ